MHLLHFRFVVVIFNAFVVFIAVRCLVQLQRTQEPIRQRAAFNHLSNYHSPVLQKNTSSEVLACAMLHVIGVRMLDDKKDVLARFCYRSCS
mmetsp:Transcript_10293/g.19756  ORF Transcript_10293/g.19756 Transcript_10293/m.19756 type:complete len:91 (+) Transcript_10293:151-423(+)